MADLKLKGSSLKVENAEEVENSDSVVYSIEPETDNENRDNLLQTRIGINIF